MFNYKLWLKSILDGLTLNGQSVPYSYGLYNGTSQNYIVGTVYNDKPSAHADDIETQTRYFIQLDIYTKVDNTVLIGEIRSKMLNADCTRSQSLESVEDDGTLVTNLFFQYERSN